MSTRFFRTLLAVVCGLSTSAVAAPTDAAALDLSGLSEPARREVTQAMSEEFCGCGAPHTLASCVQTHRGCHHSVREVQLAASLAERGATAAELGVVLAVSHFNHGLRAEESEADEAFVADLAQHHGLSLIHI